MLYKKAAAFTLVEIIMVIILLGVLSIIGVIGLGSAVSSDRAIYQRQFESSVRYAQQYAMSHFTYTFVVFQSSPPLSQPPSSNSCSIGSSAGLYNVYQICACPPSGSSSSSPVLLNNPLSQTSGYFSVSFNYGINYAVSPNSSPYYIAFNSEGQPGTSSNPINCSSSSFTLFPQLNVSGGQYYFASISFGSLASDIFYIYPNTGIVSSNGSLL
jgi:type II secretory pathway pseudopilin PulG